MKNALHHTCSLGLFILALSALGLPQRVTAQRFSHSNAAPAMSRSSAPAPRQEMSRPTAAPAPRQEVSRPVAAPRAQPAPAPAEPRATINGGSRNFGNHNFNGNNNTARTSPAPAPVAAPRVSPGSRNSARPDRRDQANIYHTGGNAGLRPYAYHPYHPYSWGPRWHPVGFFLSALAANAFRFSVGNQYYYYDDGCYYIPSSGGGYSVVPPPIGAIVSYLPDGYETTMVGNDEFYYYAGAFYIATADGQYQVVQAPDGAVVTQLPVGAVDQQINGVDYLIYNNTYYQPISQDGQDAYQVVQVN